MATAIRGHIAKGIIPRASEKCIKDAMALIYLMHEVLARDFEQFELPEWKLECFKKGILLIATQPSQIYWVLLKNLRTS